MEEKKEPLLKDLVKLAFERWEYDGSGTGHSGYDAGCCCFAVGVVHGLMQGTRRTVVNAYSNPKDRRMYEEGRGLGASLREERLACANCPWRVSEADKGFVPLAYMKDLQDRLDPGQPAPYGECPECGAFCHLIGVDDEKDNKVIDV